MSDTTTDRFAQRRAHVQIECDIESDGVRFERRTLLSRYATRVPFEAIPDDSVEEMRISRPASLAVTVSFAFLFFCLQPLRTPAGGVDPLLVPMAAAALVGSLVALWACSGQFISLVCEGRTLEFLDGAGPHSPRGFITDLQMRKGAYLTEHYGPPQSRESVSGADDDFENSIDEPGRYRH